MLIQHSYPKNPTLVQSQHPNNPTPVQSQLQYNLSAVPTTQSTKFENPIQSDLPSSKIASLRWPKQRLGIFFMLENPLTLSSCCRCTPSPIAGKPMSLCPATSLWDGSVTTLWYFCQACLVYPSLRSLTHHCCKSVTERGLLTLIICEKIKGKRLRGQSSSSIFMLCKAHDLYAQRLVISCQPNKFRPAPTVAHQQA